MSTHQTELQTESPLELERKKSFKQFSKWIGTVWTLAIAILVIVPLFDFKGNQTIVTSAYVVVWLGLIYFLLVEFSYDRCLQWYGKLYQKFHKD